MTRVERALVLLATALVLAPLARAGFVFDDATLVLHNRWTGDWSAIGLAFRHHLWAGGPDAAPTGPYYRPLMLVSLMLDRKLFGLSPVGAHLHSLAWHLLCVGLFARLLEGLGRPGAARLATVVFALHPVVVEPVAFVAARNDTMATAAILGLLILRERPGRGALQGLALLFALLSKESALAAIPVALLLDGVRGERPRDLAPLVVATGLWALLRWQADVTPLPLDAGLASLPKAVAHYLALTVWPIGTTPAAALGLAPTPVLPALAAVVLWSLVAWRGGSLARVGLLIAALTLAPGLGGVASAGLVAHRYLYLPLVGLGLALFAAIPPRADRASALGALLACALGASPQVRSWSSNETFFAYARAVQPNPLVACGLFHALEANPAGPDPAPLLREALAPPPDPNCCFNASRWPLEHGQPALAVELGELGLRRGCAVSAELLAPLSLSAAILGDWPRAEAYAARLREDPWSYAAVVRAAAALRRGDPGPRAALRPELQGRVDWLLARAEPATDAPMR